MTRVVYPGHGLACALCGRPSARVWFYSNGGVYVTHVPEDGKEEVLVCRVQ